MSKLLKRMWHSPRLTRVLLAVSVPALVTIFFAPLWAVFASIAATLASAVFIYAEVLSPKFVQQRSAGKAGKKSSTIKDKTSDEPGSSTALASADHAPRNQDESASPQTDISAESAFLSTKLGAHSIQNKEWSNYAWKALASSNSAQIEIRSVINISTHSALELANSIREIERNHDTQNHLARNLLESTSTRGNEQSSLSDLALLASTILKRQNSQLLDTAEHAASLIEKQQSAMLIAARADDLLSEADKAAKQLAMNVMGAGSDMDGFVLPDEANSKIIDPWTFIQNHRKNLAELRADLGEIRQALRQVTLDMKSKVFSLRDTAQNESEQVASVSAAIQLKLDETRSTVNALNELSKDTESHLQASIVAMQYHDIMAQKLSSVDKLHLESIAIRTRNLINGSSLHAAPEPLVVDVDATSHEVYRRELDASEVFLDRKVSTDLKMREAVSGPTTSRATELVA
jgi:hypothetical protein